MRFSIAFAALVLAAVEACDARYVEAPDAPDGGAGGAGADAAPDAVGLDADASTLDATPETDAATDAGAPCPAGFVLGPSGACELAPPFVDPGFSGAPIGAWTLGKGATLRTAEPAATDVGVARLADDAATPRYYFGSVAQTFSLPAQTMTGPLALRISFASSTQFRNAAATTPFIDGVALIDSFTTKTPTGTFAGTLETCLGDLAHGGPRELLLSPGDLFDRVDVDRVAVVPTVGCPRPGEILNADFETAGGWQFFITSRVTIAAGAGTAGSRAARFVAAGASNEAASFEQVVAIPRAGVNALTFRTYGAGHLRVRIDRRDFARVTADATRTQQRVCLPRWLRGLAVRLELVIGQSELLSADDEDDEMAVDDFAFADDPSCADELALANLGFEVAGDPLHGWFTNVTSGGSVARATTSPHGGGAYLSLETTSTSCDRASGPPPRASWVGPLPSSTATAGPAVRFWYRYAADARSVATLIVDGDTEALSPAAEWTPSTHCLSPLHAGTRAGVAFALEASFPCSGARLDVDDVELTTDPTCPR